MIKLEDLMKSVASSWNANWYKCIVLAKYREMYCHDDFLNDEQLLVKLWIKQSTVFPWFIIVIVVHLLNLSDFFVTPWSTACQPPLSYTISWSLLKFMSIESVMLSNLISSSAALFSFAFNLSQHQCLFQWVFPLHQMAKVLELQQQSFQWIFRTDFL